MAIMLSSWRVSWRNLTRHKKRFFFTLIATILGVTVMACMLIAKHTFLNVMEEQEALYAGSADFWIQSNEGTFHEADISWLKEREEIDEELSSLLKQGFVEMDADIAVQRGVRFTGISDFQTNILVLPVKEGDVKKEGLIISENAANLWNKKVGDTVTFEGLGSLEVTAIVYEGPMLNSPKTMEEAIYQDFRVIVPLNTLQSWFGLENQISNYRFKLKDGETLEERLSFCQEQLENSALFIQPIVVDSQQNNDVEGIYYVFDLIAILAVFISAFIAFNVIHTSIIERRKEIGIQKSLGYTRGQVIRLFIQEISLLSILGTIFGLLLGFWLGKGIVDILIKAIAARDIVYEIAVVEPMIIAGIAGLLFPFVAATFPIYKAGKTPILEAIYEKNTSGFSKALSIPRITIGVIFTVLGFLDEVWSILCLIIGLVLLFPLWIRLMQTILHPLLSLFFGFSGKQGIRALRQFEKRNGNTTAMLAIGVCLALFLSAELQSIPKELEEEIHSNYGGTVHLAKESPWTENELETLRNMEEIDSLYPLLEVPNVTWYTKDEELREFSIMSYSENSPSLFTIEDEVEAPGDFPAIYVGDRALREAGAKVGDVWTFNTPAGEQTFFIKGRVLTSHYSNYVAFAEENVIKEKMNWPWSYQVIIKTKEEQIPALLEKMSEHFGESISKVDTLSRMIEKTTKGITGVNDLFVGLLLLIIGISAIGISNTLFMNTMERVKEIGTMRALGFTKEQVRFMIISEGLFIGIAGVVAGIGYGILVIYLNSISSSAQGLLEFIIPWTSLVFAILGGILFTLLASWLPSSAASRISVKEAIQYE